MLLPQLQLKLPSELLLLLLHLVLTYTPVSFQQTQWLSKHYLPKTLLLKTMA